MIRLKDLPIAVANARRGGHLPSYGGCAREEDSRFPVGTYAETERELIARALWSTDGNKVHAATRLQTSRKKLHVKIEKYRFQQFEVRSEREIMSLDAVRSGIVE
jgi:DNA-binding NtrC family response regulator